MGVFGVFKKKLRVFSYALLSDRWGFESLWAHQCFLFLGGKFEGKNKAISKYKTISYMYGISYYFCNTIYCWNHIIKI